MFNTVEEAMHFLYTRESNLGMDFGLGRMENILKKLDNPERKIRTIHIAGSNGKGSTLTVLKEILMAEGLQVGSFTSPHLESVNERIMINGSMILDEEFLEIMNALAPLFEEGREAYQATFFEILTVISFVYFEKKNVDIIIYETGLGGRLDSTNVIDPLLCVITNISLEHTDILGETYREIASEKAGIIKPGRRVVTGTVNDDAITVIKDKATEEDSSLYIYKRDFNVGNITVKGSRQFFSFQMREVRFDDLELSLLGRHQAVNASLAITSALLLKEMNVFQVKEKSIREGLRNSVWRGRFELLSSQPPIILDGAHNHAGMAVLIETLKDYYPDKKYRFIFTALRDKRYEDMIGLLDEHADSVLFTEFANERAADSGLFYNQSKTIIKKQIKNWQQAIEEALCTIEENEVLIIAGSLYFLSLARPYLKAKLEHKKI